TVLRSVITIKRPLLSAVLASKHAGDNLQSCSAVRSIDRRVFARRDAISPVTLVTVVLARVDVRCGGILACRIRARRTYLASPDAALPRSEARSLGIFDRISPYHNRLGFWFVNQF